MEVGGTIWNGHTHGPIYLRQELALLEDAPVCLRDLIAVRLGLKCGLRPPEVRFQRADKISYRDQILYTTPCKGHPSRPVPVDPGTLKLIREYSSGEGVLIRAKEGYETRSNTHISDVLLFHIVKHAAKALKIQGWHMVYPYLLRHYFAASWVLKGGNIETLRRLLGHDSLISTQAYLARLIWWEDVQQDYAKIVEVGKVRDKNCDKICVHVLQDGGISNLTKIQVEILTSDRNNALEILKDLNEVLLPNMGKHPTAQLKLKLSQEGEEEPKTQFSKEGER